MEQDLRWKQRFHNFDRAFRLLGEPVERGVATLSDLEKEGMIQRFEYVFELAWKTLKDYLDYEGRTFSPVTPRSVIKEAFAAQILSDGQVWIDMLDQRNLLSHTYDAKTFDDAVQTISRRYFPAIEQLHGWLSARGGE